MNEEMLKHLGMLWGYVNRSVEMSAADSSEYTSGVYAACDDILSKLNQLVSEALPRERRVIDHGLDAYYTVVKQNVGEQIEISAKLRYNTLGCENITWYSAETPPDDDDQKLVITEKKDGRRCINIGYYVEGTKSWHGSGSMSKVIAWSDLPYTELR